uniref:Sialic acid-binding Ig-like lectin 5 isoform X2 n=1 Tax=Callorhinus ursinus TaxID=34884 RepID=A0A3Q7NPE7_CALUR|nr:sialic acid-binding Ig-like lectin 5 isoform X2 [Callorhinus ursinus]
MVPLLLLPLLWGGSPQEDPRFELRVPESVTVQEGLCVHVPCSFSYPWSSWSSPKKLYIYWFRKGDNDYLVATNDQTKTGKMGTQGRFYLVGNPRHNNCSLRIREARKSDEGVYNVRVEADHIAYSYRAKKLTVKVAALTQKPDIHFPEPLKSGYPTNLTCSMLGSCEEGRPLTFSWVGRALDSLDPQTLHSSVLTLTPRLQDHGSNLTCQVHLPGGQDTVERTIRLNVSYAPQLMTTRILQGNYTGTPSSCNCVTEKQEGSWPLVLTLIRGALMGAGFLLTYGLTWIYYSRGTRTRAPALAGADMVPLLLLPLLWGGSPQEDPRFELRVPESVTVQEGLCVHVPCSFSYPWSSWSSPKKLYIYWFRKGDNNYLVATNDQTETGKMGTQGRFYLVGNPRHNCSLRIREARKSDEGVYNVRVEADHIAYSYRAKKLTVKVAALTQKPDIHFPEPLKSGYPTNLTCSMLGSCEEGRPLTFSWVGRALDSLDPQTLHSSVLTLTPRLQDHGSNLTCQVHLPGGQDTVERTIRLNVSYAPQKLNISIFFSDVAVPKILENTSSVLILEGQALGLLCAADSSPPAELSWFRGSPARNATPIYRSANLDLPQVGAAEEGDLLTCQAQNPLGSQHVSLRLSVVYPPRLLSPSCSWEGEGLHCSCSSRAQPAPTLRWRLGEGLLEGNHSNASWTITSSSAGPWANSSLSLSGPLGSGLRLSCEARNAHGSQSAAFLLLPGRSVFLAGAVPAALGGAGAMALLSLSLCLLFFCLVKARRKQASGSREGLDDEDPVMGTVAWGSRQKPWPDSPRAQATPARDASPSGDKQELHYASFSFHGMKSREPEDEEATDTGEYSEIKTSK